jgi:hypothetical protein
MSSLFLLCDQGVQGIEPAKSKELGWYLPRKTILRKPLGLLVDPSLINGQRPSRTVLPIKIGPARLS